MRVILQVIRARNKSLTYCCCVAKPELVKLPAVVNGFSVVTSLFTIAAYGHYWSVREVRIWEVVEL